MFRIASSPNARVTDGGLKYCFEGLYCLAALLGNYQSEQSTAVGMCCLCGCCGTLLGCPS